MSIYRKVDVRIWGDERVRRLSIPKPNGRDCWLYLLTARETIILPGVIPAGAAELAESLRWTVPGFRGAFAEIEAQGMASADWEVGLVWIPKAVRYNPPGNPNVAMAWGRAFDLLPECALTLAILREVSEFIAELDLADEEGRARLMKGFRKGLPKRLETVSKSGAGAGTGAVNSLPPAQDRSGEKPTSPQSFPQPVASPPPPAFSVDRVGVARHWGNVGKQLATWAENTRILHARRFTPSSDAALALLDEWALAFALKHQPDETDMEGMHCAVLGFLDDAVMGDDEHGARWNLWVTDGVWETRWGRERARVAEERRARRAS